MQFIAGWADSTEPQILFPLIAVFLLAAIWGTTCNVLKVRRVDAEHAAAASSRELLGTYEAQVVRALGEIDETLNLVKYWPVHSGSGQHTLADLKDKGLLPPDLLFTVSIADARGVIVESTAPNKVLPSVADQDASASNATAMSFSLDSCREAPPAVRNCSSAVGSIAKRQHSMAS